MSETPKALEQMLNAWNEREPGALRGHLDKSLSEDVIFIDPTHSIVGRDAFETMVHDFRKQFPKAVATPEINDQGQVCRVEGFFGPIPGLDAD